VTVTRIRGECGGGGSQRRARRRLPETCSTATTCSNHCLCMGLLVGHILGLFSSIMMRGVDICATFYEILCFCMIPDIHFLRVYSGTKISFKICMHAMETSTTCHKFQNCIKVGIECMCRVVAILFGSAIKIPSEACASWRTRPYCKAHKFVSEK
jgi:hypothetical protein